MPNYTRSANPALSPAAAAALRLNPPKFVSFENKLPQDLAGSPPAQADVGLPGYPSMVPAETKDSAGTVDAIKKAKADALNQPDTLRGAVGRALQGFSRGFSATPAAGAYNPVAGGIAGGLAGIGATFEAEDAKRRAAAEPYDKLLAEATTEQVKQDVLAPGKRRDREANLEDERRMFDYKQAANEAAARKSLGDKGLPHDVAVDIDKEARRALMQQGVASDDPRWASAYAAATNDALARRQAQNVQGANRGRPLPVNAPQVGPDGRPPLDSFFK